MVRVVTTEMRMSDVPNVSDVMCISEPLGGGSVTVLANANGRRCLQQIFRDWDIPWGPSTSAFPSDWQHAVFPVPELASSGSHQLPPISGDLPLTEATPASLAFLLAVAARNQGARTMLWNEENSEAPLLLLVPERGGHN